MIVHRATVYKNVNIAVTNTKDTAEKHFHVRPQTAKVIQRAIKAEKEAHYRCRKEGATQTKLIKGFRQANLGSKK